MKMLNRSIAEVSIAAATAVPAIPTASTFTIPQLKELFNQGVKIQFFSNKDQKWKITTNPGWKSTVTYRVQEGFSLQGFKVTMEVDTPTTVDVPYEEYKSELHASPGGMHTMYWIIAKLSPSDQPVFSDNPHKHNTLGSAEEEATRLAKKYPNTKFTVFASRHTNVLEKGTKPVTKIVKTTKQVEL